jgi:hypothetical protein
MKEQALFAFRVNHLTPGPFPEGKGRRNSYPKMGGIFR